MAQIAEFFAGPLNVRPDHIGVYADFYEQTEWSYMLTLTVAVEKRMDGNYFRDQLLKCRDQCKLGPNFRYIMSIESHKSGYTHAHVMVGCDRPDERRFKVPVPGDWEDRVRRSESLAGGYMRSSPSVNTERRLKLLRSRLPWRAWHVDALGYHAVVGDSRRRDCKRAASTVG